MKTIPRKVFACLFVIIHAACATPAVLAQNPVATPADVPAWPGAEGVEAWKKLGAYYADKNAVIPWQDALNSLESPDAAASEHAGKFLAALFAQSFADEKNGRARWESTGSWGGGAQSAARDFRGDLAEAFGETAKSPAALPAARWLLETERVPKSQEAGMTALCRIHTPGADALLLEQLAAPHPNAAVLLAAINEALSRKLPAAAESLAKLCVHYRADIRNAARAAYTLLTGGKTPPPYDPANAFSPSLAATLRDIARMAPPVPPDAAWCLFTKAKANENKNISAQHDEPQTFSGWLCSETETGFVIIDYFAQQRTLPKAEWAAARETLAQTAQRLLAVRATPSRDSAAQLSTRGMLTGQFEPAAISVPEILTAAWLFARDERAACAMLLFPRLEKLDDARWLREIARDQIGRVAHEAMLKAFTYRRDYAATLALARWLSDGIFDGYTYHERAVELAAQLGRNTEDFRTLTLPTDDDWTRMKATMSREETIRFLAARLRLLNCIQFQQPLGGVNYGDTQYQTPMEGEVPRDKRTQVINPFNELAGMKLTPSELKLLVPYLAQRDFIPSFSYWRDFHPSRTLHRVSWVAGYIINNVAKRYLADLEKMQALDAAESPERIETILRWCDEHAAFSAADLALDTLRTTKAGDDRQWTAAIRESANQQLGVRAAEIILARANDFPKSSAQTMEGLYYLRAEKALPLARQWLTHQDGETRFWSALLILALDKNAPPQDTLAVLKNNLRLDRGEYWYMQTADTLIACHTPEAKQLALGILQRPFLQYGYSLSPFLHRFFLAGYDEAYAFALARLDDKSPSGKIVGEWEGKQITQDRHAYDWIGLMAKDWRKDWDYPINAPEDIRRQKVDELKMWLTRQREKIKRGEPSDFVQPPKPIPGWFNPRPDAP